MRRIRGPLFLAPSRYRLRRIRDAARVLPVAGALFLCMPILWGPDVVGPARNTAADLVYFFAVWAGLIGAAMVFSRSLTQGDGPEDAEDED